MKPTTEVYEIEGGVIKISHKAKEVVISANNEGRIEGPNLTFNFESALQLATVLNTLTRKNPVLPVETQGNGVMLEYPDKQPTLPAHVERNNAVAATNAMAGLMVVERGGFYLPRQGQPGQQASCTATIDSAHFFENPEEAANMAKRLGANVIMVDDVMSYRIAVQTLDNAILFWVGNNIPLSDHFNKSTLIKTRREAESVLSTVIVSEGQRKFLMPVTL